MFARIVAELLGRIPIHRLLGRTRLAVWIECTIITHASFRPYVNAWMHLALMNEKGKPAEAFLIGLVLAKRGSQRDKNNCALAVRTLRRMGPEPMERAARAVCTMLEQTVHEHGLVEAAKQLRWYMRFLEAKHLSFPSFPLVECASGCSLTTTSVA
jgi:hypothetical protein